MAAGLGNPVGAVQIAPWEPKVFTAYARQNISGGCLVFASGAADVVSSGTNSLVATDIKVATNASGTNFTGIALQSAASGSAIPIALEGIFILPAFGTVTAGAPVTCEGTNAVADGATAGQVIGKALTSATSGNYAVVYVRA
jgi:predicted RecA/RadA family phage recombinase